MGGGGFKNLMKNRNSKYGWFKTGKTAFEKASLFEQTK